MHLLMLETLIFSIYNDFADVMHFFKYQLVYTIVFKYILVSISYIHASCTYYVTNTWFRSLTLTSHIYAIRLLGIPFIP
jgi:hypothetical protein